MSPQFLKSQASSPKKMTEYVGALKGSSSFTSFYFTSDCFFALTPQLSGSLPWFFDTSSILYLVSVISVIFLLISVISSTVLFFQFSKLYRSFNRSFFFFSRSSLSFSNCYFQSLYELLYISSTYNVDTLYSVSILCCPKSSKSSFSFFSLSFKSSSMISYSPSVFTISFFNSFNFF